MVVCKLRYKCPKDISFQCLRCAQCCGDTNLHIRHVLMLKTEAQRIAKLTAKPIEEFAVETEEHEPYAYEMRKTQKEGRCVFLKSKACTIYEHRPVICRFYPFEFGPTKSHVNEFLATDECPGINQGPRALRKSYFEDLLRQLEEVSESDPVFE